MNHYFVTGSSAGIGKSLCEKLLESSDNLVTGFSRRKTIQHERYCHHELDLSDLDAVYDYKFPELESPSSVVLVNNAGTLGEVTQLGTGCSKKIWKGYNVNLVAPGIMLNRFIKRYQKLEGAHKVAVNISSGAAQSPYESWAMYCSSKAGLDMLSRVANLEQEKEEHPIHVLAIAPGVVDTAMQTILRDSDEERFPNKQKFVDLKTSGSLYGPEDVAQVLIEQIRSAANMEVVSRIKLS